MKRILILVAGLIIFGMAGSFFAQKWMGNHARQQSTPKSIESPAPQEKFFVPPTTIEIPKIQVQASIEKVGNDSEGNMDVPKNFNDVAWYQLGYIPSQKGNAAIAGHLDTVTGDPAVFYNLNKLSVGDEIFVKNDSKTLKFKVTEIQTYNFKEVPIKTVFGPNDKPRLNLVTCNGAIDETRKNYQKRLVVFSEMVE